ncbi:uncharacterized protein LOC129761806 [Toxorhynchites rutilus septentrionalis]|uniref:uncharacterized protein LOC129761806 n=1 Tax=Toxorhynchites rutilus septentrionalis TaxID=329112 RepID=UPI00247AB033|nr:uncharacterized protein LOC129761806 [Toxorhynchites rutilus septentrionalis]
MNINNLPIEILERIFLNLPLSDRKNVSIVCQRWSHAAFSWPCLGGVDLSINSSVCTDQALSTIASSQRGYRNVRFRIDQPVFGACQEQALVRILHKHRHSLERLLFIWAVEGQVFDVETFFRIARYIPLLKELCIEDCMNSSTEDGLLQGIPIESFKCVEKIVVPSCLMNNTHFDLAKLAPHANHVCVEFTGRHPWEAIQRLSQQLLSLRIAIATAYSFRPLWESKPTRLQKLSLSRNCSELMESSGIKFEEACNFFPSCGGLTVLELNFHVPNRLLEIITVCCPRLKTLLVCDIYDGWQLLRTLQRLENLTYLTIQETTFDAKHPNDASLRLSALEYIKLESIGLDNDLEFFNRLAQYIPNLNGLQFSNYGKFNDAQYNASVLKSLFCARFSNLELLILDDFSCVFPSHMLDHLNNQPRLKELGLRFCDISPWSRTITIPSVRKMALEIPLTANRERNLKNVFPSLTQTVYAIESLSERISPSEFYNPTNKRIGLRSTSTDDFREHF